MAELAVLDEKIKRLMDERQAAIDALRAVKDADENQYDLAHGYGDRALSFTDADARIIAVCEMLGGAKAKKDALLVPQEYVDHVANSLDTIVNRYGQISTGLRNVQDNGGVGQLDLENGVLTSANSQATFKLAGQAQNLWNETESALISLYPLLFAIDIKGQADFTPLLQSFKAATKQAKTHEGELSKIAKQARTSHDQLIQLEQQGTKLREEIERLQTEGARDRTTLSEYAGEATQSVSSIRSTKEQAEQLQSEVESYKAAFENFQKQLKQRENALSTGTERQNKLITRVEEIQTEIEGLNQRAEAMLSGATVAGLASSFGKHRDDLNKELLWARAGFYVAIGFLFISVVPLALYIIPGLGEYFTGPEATEAAEAASASELIGQIAARALLLLPGAWLTKFAASRYASLFKLKEHYVYKLSVASSVEGFKKQAEQYKDEIAAATFFELTFNPANRLEKTSDEERHPNPVMEYLMKRIGATHDGKG